MTQKIDITLSPKPVSYPIVFGDRYTLLDTLKSIKAFQYVIITDTTVEPLFGKPLMQFLKENGLNVSLACFPAGEEYKTRETKHSCEDHLLKVGAGRDTCVVGLGGGIVTDVAGFVAATYCRGVPAVMVPTTLLAMVDASVGGKTGVNVPQGKNLIGTFSQPKAVIIDTEMLKTLHEDDIKGGVSEMIKHGLIADKNHFHFLKTHAKKLLKLENMNEAIQQSIQIKADVVQEDETEQGKRRLLNLGHTIAHALESASKHAISHGKAVAVGCLAESYLSMLMGHLSQKELGEIQAIYNDFKIDLSYNQPLSPDKLLEIMRMDKKSLRKTPRFVVLEMIGKPLPFEGQFCSEVEEPILRKTLDWMCTDVMRSD